MDETKNFLLYDEVIQRHQVENKHLNNLYERLEDLNQFEKTLQLQASKCLVETGAGCYLQAEITDQNNILYNLGCDIFISCSASEALEQIELDKTRVMAEIDSIKNDLGEDYYILQMQEAAMGQFINNDRVGRQEDLCLKNQTHDKQS